MIVERDSDYNLFDIEQGYLQDQSIMSMIKVRENLYLAGPPLHYKLMSKE